MGANTENMARANLNASVDVLCLMQKRWTHDRSNAVQWAEQERATAEYQEAVDRYRAAVLASARERVEALVPTYRAFAGDDELLINRAAAVRAITEAT